MILAVAGLAACTASSAPNSSSTATEPASHRSSPAQVAGVTVCVTPVVTCTDEMKTEPAIITTSADGAVYIRKLTWRNWGSAAAVGSGTLERDNCQPSCANGTYAPYSATVTLSNLTPYGDGKMAYATMAISAPADNYHEIFSTGLVP
jgi:hypothetical protein